MRQNNFKIWSKVKREMSMPMDIFFIANWLDLKRHEGADFEHFEFLKGSGLTDPNGLEVFEGDILLSGTDKFEVVFEFGCFMAYRIDAETREFSYADILLMRRRISEIIGNTRENPELIK